MIFDLGVFQRLINYPENTVKIMSDELIKTGNRRRRKRYKHEDNAIIFNFFLYFRPGI